MDTKKIIAVSAVALMLAMSLVCCIPSASADAHEELSAKDVSFSRATVSYLTDVTYGEHSDRNDCWFFISGSANEKAFTDYVLKKTGTVPTADDRAELSKDPTKKCNIYNLGLEPKFKVNAPLLTIDYVKVSVKSGQRLTVEITGDVGDWYNIKNTASSGFTQWYYGKTYITTAEKDTDYMIFAYNEQFSGGSIDIKDLFTTVSYDITVSSGSVDGGNNALFAAVMFILGAAVIAVIVLCAKRIDWAKDAPKSGDITADSSESTEEEKK